MKGMKKAKVQDSSQAFPRAEAKVFLVSGVVREIECVFERVSQRVVRE